MTRILIVDDEPAMASLLQSSLEAEEYEAEFTTSGEEAIRAIRESEFDVVITDLAMKPVDGLAVIRATKETSPETEVMIMTAYASVETAVEALKSGAFDYLIKPFSTDELLLRIRKILDQQSLRQENRQLRETLETRATFDNMVGDSKQMQDVFKLVEKVAGTRATVLLRGESGTGKELLAEAIHVRSDRKDHPLVKINCAAIPETLLESELFGHEKGAFTGAHRQKKGRFELAGKGTIFLDEIGDLTPSLQVKLLRVLQQGEFERVGGVTTLRSEARVVAATHRDLEQAISQGTFRKDLFYRLNVFPIWVPPLRDRKEGIPALVMHFIRKHGRPEDGIDSVALDVLTRYSWPGNVRELENAIERSLIMKNGNSISLSDLPADLVRPVALSLDNVAIEIPEGGIQFEELERGVILRALEMAEGNKSKAAKLLGISRRRLYSRLEILGIPINDG